MKVIITGGTGRIGSRLSQSLIADGHDVIVLSRSPQTKRKAIPTNAKIVGWDAETASGWGDYVNEADAILNFAGEDLAGGSFIPKRWTDERKRKIRASRRKAGEAVVAALRQAHHTPNLLLQPSASGYYGTNLSDEVKTEDSPAGDDFLAEVCQEWEAATKQVEQMGIRRVITRTGLVLEKDEGALPRLALPFKLFAGGRLGSGEQYYPWIHIEDEVRAIRHLLELPDASGPYNLAAPSPAKNRRMAEALGHVLNRPSLLPVPAFAMRLALGEVATLVLGGQRMVPERLQQSGFEFKYPDLEPALADLLA